jgi:hypothetical protein
MNDALMNNWLVESVTCFKLFYQSFPGDTENKITCLIPSGMIFRRLEMRVRASTCVVSKIAHASGLLTRVLCLGAIVYSG